MTPDLLIKKYIELRDHIEKRAAEHVEELKPYQDGMTAIEGAFQAYLLASNLDNVKSEFGTAYKKTSTRIKLADRGAFIDFIQTLEEDPFAFFTNAISKEKIVDYIKEHDNVAPPGVDVTYITDVNFNRPRSS